MGLILVTLSAVEMLPLGFAAKYNYAIEGGHYELEFNRPVTESVNAGVTVTDGGRTTVFFKGSWDNWNIFKYAKPSEGVQK